MSKRILILMLFIFFCFQCFNAGFLKEGKTDFSSAILEITQTIKQAMQENNIPGIAVTFVEGDSIVWAKGFGYTGFDKKYAVTPETIFNVQSTFGWVTTSNNLLHAIGQIKNGSSIQKTDG